MKWLVFTGESGAAVHFSFTQEADGKYCFTGRTGQRYRLDADEAFTVALKAMFFQWTKIAPGQGLFGELFCTDNPAVVATSYLTKQLDQRVAVMEQAPYALAFNARAKWMERCKGIGGGTPEHPLGTVMEFTFTEGAMERMFDCFERSMDNQLQPDDKVFLEQFAEATQAMWTAFVMGDVYTLKHQ